MLHWKRGLRLFLIRICTNWKFFAWFLFQFTTCTCNKFQGLLDTALNKCWVLIIIIGRTLSHSGQVIQCILLVLYILLVECLKFLESILHILVFLSRNIPGSSPFLLLCHLIFENLLYLFIQNLHWVTRVKNIVFGFISNFLDKSLALLAGLSLRKIFTQVTGYLFLHEFGKIYLLPFFSLNRRCLLCLLLQYLLSIIQEILNLNVTYLS